MATVGESRRCFVVLHDDRTSTEAVLSGANILDPGGVGMLLAPGAKELCIIARALAASAGEVSLHVSLGARFGFQNRTEAMITPVHDIDGATATHLELFFRDQHLSRADIWRLMNTIDGSVVYRGQLLEYLGPNAVIVEAIHIAGIEVDSAVVSQLSTKPIFRSGSARYTILIQVSQEMLECWTDGDLIYERVIDGFLPELFRRWETVGVRHSISVVLFGRTGGAPETNGISRNATQAASATQRSGCGDFFYVVAEGLTSVNCTWLLHRLKSLFSGRILPCNVSLASRGNLLEAIHMAAQEFADDNIDPDLTSTGSSIIAITAGAGLFEAVHAMFRRTTELLMGHSIGVDIVALSPKPVHPVPLFQYTLDGKVEYGLPHWADISFWPPEPLMYSSRMMLPEVPTQVDNVALPLLQADLTHADSHTALPVMAAHDEEQFAALPHVVAITPLNEDAALLGPSAASAATLRGATTTLGHEQITAAKLMQEAVLHDSELPQGVVKARSGMMHSLLQTDRKISLGPRGLAPSIGKASTTVSVEHAQHDRELPQAAPSAPRDVSSGLAKQIRQSLQRKTSQQSLTSQRTSEITLMTQPIPITTGQDAKLDESEDSASLLGSVAEEDDYPHPSQEDSRLSQTPKPLRGTTLFSTLDATEATNPSQSPWLTLLNPCNPCRDNMQVASQYRMWQRVFPKAVNSGVFKWESMTSPAALPLTIEHLPTAEELQKHYDTTLRRLVLSRDHRGTPSNAVRLVDQLTALRLACGFQIVRPQHKEGTGEAEVRISLSLGDSFHEIQCISNIEVQVVEHLLRTDADCADGSVIWKQPEYRPQVRNDHSGASANAEVSFASKAPLANWSTLDQQLCPESMLSTHACLSRMRFVLVPTESPTAEKVTAPRARDLSDEEKRTDGIQKLTQLWQRNRHFSDEDKGRQATLVRPKATDRDPNPLSIEYVTRDPSALVGAYGPGLTAALADGENTIPLFAESDMYHSSNFDITKLVRHMQKDLPHGVEVRDRRWFTRLHLRCFRGDEMTNWLLRAFKDLHTREDAVDMGNELMNRGIFTHVRHKHAFRDGNYFYQISGAHRTTEYPDTAALFKLPGRSVPPAPAKEMRSSPMIRPVRDDSESSGKDTPSLPATERKQVVLSQVMQYNVDPTNKSDQLEVINLHYDRIHNPENCYHIQLDWVNTTPKLIQEAATRWAALVQGYGLRLVQVPLDEAAKQVIRHTFNQPLHIKLATAPPERALDTPHLDLHASAPQVIDGDPTYHKALLRRLGFVLDLEAASSFQASVDASYSWGRPDYELTQFVHGSGLLLAQIEPKHSESDFLLMPNRLAPQRGSGKVDEQVSVEAALKDIRTFCGDEETLKAFYEELNKPRMSAPSPMAQAALAADSDVPAIRLPPHLLERFPP